MQYSPSKFKKTAPNFFNKSRMADNQKDISFADFSSFTKSVLGKKPNDTLFKIYQDIVPGQKLSIVIFLRSVGKLKKNNLQILGDFEQSIFLSLKTFLASVIDAGKDRIILGINTTLSYIQKKLVDTQYIDFFNNGFCASILIKKDS